MKIILITLKKTLFWSYERGTWQYDLLCVLILAFIFFTPNELFHKDGTAASHSGQAAGISSEMQKRAVGAGDAIASPDQLTPGGEKATPAVK